MAIIGSVFGLVGRFAGRVLNSALGWASLLLFGRVPQSKQIILVGVTFGSLIWVVTVLGVIVPAIATFLLALVPIPKFINENWVRLAMLVAAIVLPALIGIASLFLTDAADRPKGAGLITGVLRGYPFAFVLAVSLAFLGVIALYRKVRALAKRWEDAHVPIVVKPGCYDEVTDALRSALDDEQLGVQTVPAPRTLEIPAHLLASVAGGGVKRLVPDRLAELKGENLDVLLYPSDISISGTKDRVARARGAIASRLTSAPAYMTTSEEAEKVEDRIEAVARRVREAGPSPSDGLVRRVRADLRAVDADLRHLTVSYDEWETLYRMRLQVERDLLSSDVDEAAMTARAVAAVRVGSARTNTEPGPLSPVLQWAASIGALSLVALDVALAVLERVSPPRARSRLPWER